VFSAISIVIGITIGSGIFRTPAAIASRVPDARLMLSVWLLGGLISLCGALSVAELAAALPASGGWYVYLRESWGRLAAFLFGWAELVLIRASAVGALSTVFAEYLLRSFGVEPTAFPHQTNYVAAAAIVIAGWSNIRGVSLAASIISASTVAKFSALSFVVALSFALGGRAGASTTHFFTQPELPVTSGLFGLALISVLWAYDGFGDISMVAGEVAHPSRTLPRAIVGGTLAIVTIYVLANAAYLYVNSVDAIAKSPLVAADTMRALVGPSGGVLISIVVAISTFGALNATMLGPPRVFFAMAKDRLFFRSVARIHPRYGTPYVAIVLAMLLGVGFVLTRTFEQLADTFVLSIWPFYGLAIAGLYRLRRVQPDLRRPYLTPGYPVVPAVFIAGVIYLVANALVTDTLWTLVTFGIVLAGVPVYYAVFARSTITPRPSHTT
jgi:amino acid transporter